MKKIPDITNLAIKAILNTKTTEFESKITDVASLAANAALNIKATETENKIPNTKHFITTLEFNRLTKISFDAKMKELSKIPGKKSSRSTTWNIR